jgi:uncharacterized protein (DUF302 family)
MTNGNGPPVTFSMQEPYRLALRMVRRALTQEGLHAPVELDVASRIKKELGAGVAPCTVLFVDDPALLLEAIVFHRGAALGTPQPVVVSGNNRGTEVLIRSSESLVSGVFPASAHDPLLQLHGRILRAMEMVATRDGASLAGNFELCSSHSKGDLLCKRNTPR